MNSIFNKMFITKAEYFLVKTMDASDKIAYLFDIFETTTMQTGKFLDLSAFFTEVRDNLNQYNSVDVHDDLIKTNELSDLANEKNLDFVDVLIDDRSIMIESNSLRATKHVIHKFVEAGYILSRDVVTEKMFKKDKVTRYIRVFKIIHQANSMCPN